ncbi:hypothetical protein DYB28_009723 [Aphanomyces astaci]|uniref:Uncharacterized protein n=1 Tax=Aphanomyces astaci TaxID=112090 RepID=A0A9X8DY92_APHAT|nr:hypothetical protein DYB28_009723 [Aphanomyces astaci]
MSRLENFRSIANQAGQTMYAGASLAASVSKEKASLVASVGKEKGLKAYSHAAVAASAGRTTLETRIKKVQTSSTFKTVKQRLWSKSGRPQPESDDVVPPVAFASTEKEYYKVDPSTVLKRSQSSRGVKSKKAARPSQAVAAAPVLKRSVSSVETGSADLRRRHGSGSKTRSPPQEVEF